MAQLNDGAAKPCPTNLLATSLKCAKEQGRVMKCCQVIHTLPLNWRNNKDTTYSFYKSEKMPTY